MRRSDVFLKSCNPERPDGSFESLSSGVDGFRGDVLGSCSLNQSPCRGKRRHVRDGGNTKPSGDRRYGSRGRGRSTDDPQARRPPYDSQAGTFGVGILTPGCWYSWGCNVCVEASGVDFRQLEAALCGGHLMKWLLSTFRFRIGRRHLCVRHSSEDVRPMEIA